MAENISEATEVTPEVNPTPGGAPANDNATVPAEVSAAEATPGGAAANDDNAAVPVTAPATEATTGGVSDNDNAAVSGNSSKASTATDNTATGGLKTSEGVESIAETASLVVTPKDSNQPAPAQDSIFSGPFIWILLLGFIAFQFIFSSKNRKRQQAEAEKLKALSKGDRVLTIGRMHGTVVALTDDTMTLKTDEKGINTLVFDRAALYKILSRPDDKDKAEGSERK